YPTIRIYFKLLPPLIELSGQFLTSGPSNAVEVSRVSTDNKIVPLVERAGFERSAHVLLDVGQNVSPHTPLCRLGEQLQDPGGNHYFGAGPVVVLDRSASRLGLDHFDHVVVLEDFDVIADLADPLT